MIVCLPATTGGGSGDSGLGKGRSGGGGGGGGGSAAPGVSGKIGARKRIGGAKVIVCVPVLNFRMLFRCPVLPWLAFQASYYSYKSIYLCALCYNDNCRGLVPGKQTNSQHITHC